MGLALDALDLDRDEIARRFAWARRRAQPAWLWPDVQPEEWRRAMGRIEAAIRPILAGGSAGEPLGGDPRALGLAGYISGMGPLLGHWLEAGLLSAEPAIADLLALQLRHNRIRMEGLAREAASAAALLAGAGIVPTILKGMHTAWEYFPEPGTRPCSDIDIFIAQDEMARAEEVLASAGYAPGPRAASAAGRSWTAACAPIRLKSLTFVHADDPWTLDVHGSLDRPFSKLVVARLQRLAGTAGSTPSAVSPDAHVLGQPLLTLQLAAHASQDLANLTLLRLVELAWVIRRDVAAGRLSWEAATAAARRIEALGFLYPALEFAEQLLPGTVPEDVLLECGEAAPAAVRRMLRKFTPATAQRVDRWSLRERYMWCPTWKSRLRQTAHYLAPGAGRHRPRQLLAFYGWRARRGFKAATGW